MWCYGCKRAFTPGDRVGDWPELARIRAAGPLMWWAEDGMTMVAVKALCGGKPLCLSDLAAPVECSDGLVYYGPREPLTPGDLRHDLATLPWLINVPLAKGISLDIVPATLSPRKVLFGGGSAVTGEFASTYGQDADRLHQVTMRVRDLHQRIGTLSVDSPDRTALEQELETLQPQGEQLQIPVVLQAIQSAYYVTEDVLNDCAWITTQDIEPLLCAAWGVDPKVLLEPDSGAGG